MSASRADLGPFYRDVIAVDPLEPYEEASAAYRLKVLARQLPFVDHGVLDAAAERLAELANPVTTRCTPCAA